MTHHTNDMRQYIDASSREIEVDLLEESETYFNQDDCTNDPDYIMEYCIIELEDSQYASISKSLIENENIDCEIINENCLKILEEDIDYIDYESLPGYKQISTQELFEESVQDIPTKNLQDLLTNLEQLSQTWKFIKENSNNDEYNMGIQDAYFRAANDIDEIIKEVSKKLTREIV